MKIVILNSILYTCLGDQEVRKVTSIEDTLIYNFAQKFVEEGHQVTVIAAEEYRPTQEETYAFEIRFFPSVCKKILPPTLLPLHTALIGYLRKHKEEIDLVISSDVFTFNSLFASLILPQKTIIWQELGVHNKKLHQLPSRIWYNVVAPLAMRRPYVIARSQRSRAFIKRYLPKVSDLVIGHGIDTSKFTPSTQKSDQLIVVAQLIPRKNLPSILEIFARFLAKYPTHSHYQLYFAGSGALLEELQQQTQQLQITQSVHFLGHLPHVELAHYLRHSKATLINSHNELNIVSITEAIAMATPVLTNTVPFNSDEVAANQLGIVQDGWNEDTLYEILEKNNYYVEQCLNYRERMTTQWVTSQFLSFYNTHIQKTGQK